LRATCRTASRKAETKNGTSRDQSNSVADQVASILRRRILDGELLPGTALQEVPMATSLGVSRNTVREATRILSLEGLLKRSAHRGVAVAQLSLEDVAGNLSSAPSTGNSSGTSGKDGRLRRFDGNGARALEGYEEAVEGVD